MLTATVASGTYYVVVGSHGGYGDVGQYTVSVLADTNLLTSSVATLPSYTSTTNFTVRWSGGNTANGSGIAFYDLFVSADGGAFTPWLTATTQTSATFTGTDGHAYGFYSVATDNAGNREATPTAAQATTRIDTQAPSSSVAELPEAEPADVHPELVRQR